MDCGTCGSGRSAAATRNRSGLYVLTTPQGKVKTYASEAEAKKAQSRLGGTVKVSSG